MRGQTDLERLATAELTATGWHVGALVAVLAWVHLAPHRPVAGAGLLADRGLPVLGTSLLVASLAAAVLVRRDPRRPGPWAGTLAAVLCLAATATGCLAGLTVWISLVTAPSG